MLPETPRDFLLSNNLDLDSLLEKAKVPLFEVCYNSETKFISFNYCSKEVLNIFEIDEELFQSDHSILFNRLHEDDKSQVIKGIKSSFLNRSTWICDFKIVLPSQGLRYINVQSPIEVIDEHNYLMSGYLFDITDQVLVEKELQEKRERLSMALQNSRDGVWDWDVITEKVFYSQESLDIIGYSRADFAKSADAWNDLVHPDDRSKYYQDIEDHFSGKTSYYKNEHRVKCKNGMYKWVLDRGKVIERCPNGKPCRVIGTHTDITDQKNREDAISQTVATVEVQNERLLNFAHIVSHNLRSHSGNFETILKMMSESNEVDDKLSYVEYLEKISQSLSDTIAHLNDVVSVQTKSKNKLEKLSLNKFIENTRHVLYADILSSNAILMNRVEEDDYIMYNPAYLESIILNFISNGIKYKHPDRAPKIEISTEFEKGCLVLVFKDNGIGIDLDRFGHKIFGMYQTFHSNDDARGVGLFITKNQIESMGGTVAVESTVGEGATFRVYFNKSTY